MEPDATVEVPAADADDARPESSEESASPSTSPSQEDAFMNAMIRGQLGIADSTSKPDGDGDSASTAEAADGESAPGDSSPGDVKPSSAAPGRRRSADEIKRLSDENASLKARVEELVPTPPDASEEQRKAILAAEQRYRTLDAKPDDDSDWTTEDYQWLQAEKRKRATVPELRQHYETVLEHDRRVLRETTDTERQTFWSHVTADMASGADLPGVDMAQLKAAPNFASRDRLIYAAAAATRDAEIRAVREENDQLKRDLLGTVRPPLNGGRSSPGQTYDEDAFMNNLMRRGVRA